MKRIPDLLSMSRIVLCLPLLIVDAMTIPFWVIYLIAGLTDILDGFLARRWGVESKFGARLDSLADFVFVLVVGYKLFPWLRLPATLWMMIGLIALIKVANAISSYMVTSDRVPTHQSQQIDWLLSLYRYDGDWTVILCPGCMDDCLHRPLRRYTGGALYS